MAAEKAPLSNVVDSCCVDSQSSLQGRRRTVWKIIIVWDLDHVFKGVLCRAHKELH